MPERSTESLQAIFQKIFDEDNAALRVNPTGLFGEGFTVDAETSEVVPDPDFFGANVLSHGADPTGVADSTTAIQAAMDAAATPGGGSNGISGGTVFFPPGVYKITSTLTLAKQGLIMQGSGLGNTADDAQKPGKGTTLRWHGATGQPMLKITDSRFDRICDIRFEGNDSNPPSEGIYFEGDGGGVGTNKQQGVYRCHFGDWTWSGSDTGAMAHGIRVGGASNTNNAEFHFVDCVFRVCTTAGVAIDNSQSIWGHLHNCIFRTCGTALKTSASVQVSNMQCTNSVTLDVDVSGTAGFIAYGFYSEGAPLIFRANDQGGKIVVYGGKIGQQEGMTGGIWANHLACGAGGMMVFEDVWLDDQGASPTPVLKVRGNASSSSGSVRIQGGIGFNAIGLYDIAAGAGTGGLVVDINSRNFIVRKKYLASAAMVAADAWAAQGAYTPTNVTTDRSFDANATSIDELADALGTLIADLKTAGVIG